VRAFHVAAFAATIAGRSAPVRIEGNRLSFELPDDEGAFRGRRKALQTEFG
jgi:hypothetical protein